MRRMMFSPEMMRMQLQMQRSMGDRNGGGSSFPAPGATDNTPESNSTTTGNNTTTTPSQPNTVPPMDPFAALGGGAGAGGNPFAGLFAGGQNPFAPQPQQDQTPNPTSTTQAPQDGSSAAPPNPFPNLFGGAQGGQANPIAEAARNLMQNPEAMRSMMQMMGGGQGASPFTPFGQTPTSTTPAPGTGTNSPPAMNPFAALFGPGAFGPGGGFGTPPPADNRPPEELYETQLRQLNEMGFYEFERNVSALRRSGGNVQGAIEYLLNGGS